MLSPRIASIIIAISTFISGNSYAHAGDETRFERHHHGHKNQQRSFYGGDGLPSYVGGIGAYSGGIIAVRSRYNGVYFAVERWRYPNSSTTSNTVRPRIIHVNRKTAGAECSYEAGVCVIRP